MALTRNPLQVQALMSLQRANESGESATKIQDSNKTDHYSAYCMELFERRPDSLVKWMESEKHLSSFNVTTEDKQEYIKVSGQGMELGIFGGRLSIIRNKKQFSFIIKRKVFENV